MTNLMSSVFSPVYTMGSGKPRAYSRIKMFNDFETLEDLISSFFYSFPSEPKPPIAYTVNFSEKAKESANTKVDFNEATGITVQMAVAGCKEEDIKVWCEDKALVVQGSNESHNVSDKFKLNFKRIFPVSKELDPLKATAKVEDGILTVEIPLADQTENRTYILGSG